MKTEGILMITGFMDKYNPSEHITSLKISGEIDSFKSPVRTNSSDL